MKAPSWGVASVDGVGALHICIRGDGEGGGGDGGGGRGRAMDVFLQVVTLPAPKKVLRERGQVAKPEQEAR